MNIDRLNTMDEAAAREALTRCCGSTRWVQGMLAARPFADWQALVRTADTIWNGLSKDDWLEAFSHHPRIGDRKIAERAGNTVDWAKGEQAGAMSADAQVKAALAELNVTYEARFGFIYLVCATGKTGAELLALLQARLLNEAGPELLVAKDEQAKITRLRLEKLLA